MTVVKTRETDHILGYTCTNSQGFSVKILNFGGVIQSIRLPKGGDVALGYGILEQYMTEPFFFGTAIGPIANRISGGFFTFQGEPCSLEQNDGSSNMHSGSYGLHSKFFTGEVEGDKLILRTTAPNLEGGFPGTQWIEIHYQVTEDNALSIEYFVKTDREAPINLTNHCYFNLDGHRTPTCLENVLEIRAKEYTYNDSSCLPTGEIRPVAGTPLDFNQPKPIGQDLAQEDVNLTNVGGYDHNFLVNDTKTIMEVAVVTGKLGKMTVETDCPCLQFYSGNFITRHPGKEGTFYQKHSGFCLETGAYPDSVNRPEFPDSIVKPGELWTSTTIYRFFEG